MRVEGDHATLRGVREAELSDTDARGRRLAAQDRARFGVVLLLLLATFVFLSTGQTGSWAIVVSTVLQGATLLAAFRASHTERRWMKVAYVVVGASLVVSIAALFASADTTTATLYGLNAVLVLTAPIAIARGALRRELDIQTVLSAICIYVLIGMLWAFVFGTISEVGSKPFFAQTAEATSADYLYYSYVTLTTVGYGDLTAIGGLGRAVSVLEALVGQLYLVTVVALVVSNLGRVGVRRGRPAP